MLPFSMRLLFILRCTLFTKRRRTTTKKKSIPLPFIKLIEKFLFFFVRSNGSNFHPSAHSLSAYWWIQAKYKSVVICFFFSSCSLFRMEEWILDSCRVYHLLSSFLATESMYVYVCAYLLESHLFHLFSYLWSLVHRYETFKHATKRTKVHISIETKKKYR